MRLDGGEDGGVLCVSEPGRDAAPEDPEGGPYRRFLVMRDALREERCHLLATPGVERGAEPGTEGEPAQLQEQALVIGRAPALLRARPEDAPQIAAGRERPGRAVAERALEVAPKVLHFAPHVAGLLPVDLLDGVACLIDRLGQRRDRTAGRVVAGRRLAKLEFELPGRRVVNTEQLEGAD